MAAFLRIVLVALAISSNLWAIEGFRPVGSYFRGALRQRVQNASVRLEITSPTGLIRCSGTVLSPEGYILTSLHCLSEILLQKGDAQILSLLPSNGQFLDVTRTPARSVLTEVTVFSSRSLSLGHPELVAVGPGAMMHFPFVYFINNNLLRHSSDVSVEDILRWQRRAGDFAILKVNRVDQHAGARCLSLPADSSSLDVQNVFSIGYPLEARRPRGMSANGRSLVASQGQVLNGLENTPVVLRSHLNDEQNRTLNDVSFSAGLHLADLDAVPGSSGGAVVNDNAEFLAIVTLSMSTSTAYNASAAYILETRTIRDILVQNIGEFETSQIFNCQI